MNQEIDPQVPLLSVAPMMDWTDVHFRYMARLLTKRTQLWTEMVVDKTIIHTDQLDRFLWFPPQQHPLVCQIGGSDPNELAEAAKKVQEYGYDEINLNCGCPSDRVAGAGCFGAALMLQPELVGECMKAIAAAVDVQVTVKCRLGADDMDSYQDVCRFIHTVSSMAPVTHFIIHCRKCFLSGLNPHQNRTIPPLRYEWPFALKRDFPHLKFTLNGGILTPVQAKQILNTKMKSPNDQINSPIHGVMIGRGAYNDPWRCLSQADTIIYGKESNPAISRRQVVKDYCEKYADQMVGKWFTTPNGRKAPSVRSMIIPLFNLFYGVRGTRQWKSMIDDILKENPQTVSEVAYATLNVFEDEVLDEPPGGEITALEYENNFLFELGDLPPKISLRELDRVDLQSESGSGKRQKLSQDEEWLDVEGLLPTVEVISS